MSQNGTKLFYTEEQLLQKRRIYSQYMGQGVLLTVANLLVFGAVIRTPSIRVKKPYVFVAGLALIDLILGVQLLFQSSFRNVIMALDLAQTPISPSECLLQPWNLAANFKDSVAGPMMFVQSVDRFFAITLPLQYYGWTTTYALALTSIPYLFGFANIALLVYHVLHHTEPLVSLICISHEGFKDTWMEMLLFRYWVEILTTTGSVVVCAIVLTILARYKPQGSEREQQDHMRQQRRLTVTVGITSFFTLLLHTSTRFVNIGSAIIGQEGLGEIPVVGGLLYFWDVNESLIRHVNPFLNVFIYTWKQKEMHIAIKYMVKCQKLTSVKLQQEMNKDVNTVTKSRHVKVEPAKPEE